MHAVRYDLVPPSFIPNKGTLSVINRVKNPSRMVSAQFSGPVQLAATASGTVGHYDVSTSLFWGETSCVGVPVPLADLTLLTPPPEAVTIPAGAAMDVATASDPCFDFLDFSLPPGVPAMLAVHTRGDDAAAVPDVSDLTVVHSVPAFPDAFAPTAASHPWRYVELENRSVACEVANRFLVAGWSVSVPMPKQEAGGAHPRHRVQGSVLRWVKDSEVDHALSKFADSMPGMACMPPSVSVKDALFSECAVTLRDVVYDAEVNVPRSMMSWGAVAAWVCKDYQRGKSVAGVCEPLASYVGAVLAIQKKRNGSVGPAPAGPAPAGPAPAGPTPAAAAAAPPLLQWNSPQKMSVEQVKHAAALFYWAAVHRDDRTRLMSVSLAKTSLELYLRFGFVFLRKRAYQFHGKKRRRGHEDGADAENV